MDKNVANVNFCYGLSILLSVDVMQVVPLKYSEMLNISGCNHRLSNTIIILLNLKDKRPKFQ